MIICLGISVGFLLGMGVSPLTRGMIAGANRGLETAFTPLVKLMVGLLITYGLKSITDNPQMADTGNDDSLSGTRSPPAEANEKATVANSR